MTRRASKSISCHTKSATKMFHHHRRHHHHKSKSESYFHLPIPNRPELTNSIQWALSTLSILFSHYPQPRRIRINRATTLLNSATTTTLLTLITLMGLIASSHQEEFDIGKLLEYNKLASCIGHIHEDFVKCNTASAEKAQSSIAKMEFGTEFNKRLKCCGMWKLRDCWMKSARSKCTKAQADQIFSLPKLFMPAMVDECMEYTPESGKCSLPMWLIAGGVSTILLLIATCLCGTLYCIRRARKRSRRRSRKHVHGHKSRSRSTSGTNSTALLTSATKGTHDRHVHNHHHLNGKKPNGCPHQQPPQPYMNGHVSNGGDQGAKTPAVHIQITEPSVVELEEEDERKSLNGGPKENLNNV